jgi:multidrug efflux pump
MAFILGVTPLAISSGAGSGSQNALGIGVIGGMLTATFLATFLIPLFYVLVAGRSKPPVAHAPPPSPPAAHPPKAEAEAKAKAADTMPASQ